MLSFVAEGPTYDTGSCEVPSGYQVGKLLGHKSLASTQVYARADNRSARKAADLTVQRLAEALAGEVDDGEGTVDDAVTEPSEE